MSNVYECRHERRRAVLRVLRVLGSVCWSGVLGLQGCMPGRDEAPAGPGSMAQGQGAAVAQTVSAAASAGHSAPVGEGAQAWLPEEAPRNGWWLADLARGVVIAYPADPSAGAGVVAGVGAQAGSGAPPGLMLDPAQGRPWAPMAYWRGSNVQYDPEHDAVYVAAGSDVVAGREVAPMRVLRYDRAQHLAAGALPTHSFELPPELYALGVLRLAVTTDTLYVGGGWRDRSGATQAAVLVYEGVSRWSQGADRVTPLRPSQVQLLGSGAAVMDLVVDAAQGTMYVLRANTPGLFVSMARAGSGDGAGTGALGEALPDPQSEQPRHFTSVALDETRRVLYLLDDRMVLHTVSLEASRPQWRTRTASGISSSVAAYLTVDAPQDQLYIAASTGLYRVDRASQVGRSGLVRLGEQTQALVQDPAARWGGLAVACGAPSQCRGNAQAVAR